MRRHHSIHSLLLVYLFCFLLTQLNHYYALSYLGPQWLASELYQEQTLNYLIPVFTVINASVSILLSSKLRALNTKSSIQLMLILNSIACLILPFPYTLLLYASFILNSLSFAVGLFTLNVVLSSIREQSTQASWSVAITMVYSVASVMSVIIFIALSSFFSYQNYCFIMTGINVSACLCVSLFIPSNKIQIDKHHISLFQYLTIFKHKTFSSVWLGSAVMFTIVLYYIITFQGFNNLSQSMSISQPVIYILLFFSSFGSMASKIISTIYCKRTKQFHNFYHIPMLLTVLVFGLVSISNNLHAWFCAYVLIGAIQGLVTPLVYIAAMGLPDTRSQLCARASVNLLYLFSAGILSFWVTCDRVYHLSTTATSLGIFGVSLVLYVLQYRLGIFTKRQIISKS
ncbi:MAG: MFS transporter [Pseudomonadota bacterium]|nr:MFS transporter [Pseudomonadota bacterium]